MKYKGDFVIIAKDGWPLEQFVGKPITNFFRRLFLGSHKECRACQPTNTLCEAPPTRPDVIHRPILNAVPLGMERWNVCINGQPVLAVNSIYEAKTVLSNLHEALSASKQSFSGRPIPIGPKFGE